MIKRGFYYLACGMFMLNLLLWAMFICPNISTEEIIHGDSRIWGEIFSFIVLMAIPVVIFACLHRILKWRIYSAFGILHYYDPSIKQLRKLRIGDSILFVLAESSSDRDGVIYTVTDCFLQANCLLNLRFFKTFSKCFELTGGEGDKLSLSLVGKDKIKFSKQISINDFCNHIHPLTETEILKSVNDRKSFCITYKPDSLISDWVVSGEKFLKSSRLAYLKENVSALKSDDGDFYYCFSDSWDNKKYSSSTDYDYFPTNLETGFEIKVQKGMLEDVRIAYTSNILDYKDRIHINPKMEDTTPIFAG